MRRRLALLAVLLAGLTASVAVPSPVAATTRATCSAGYVAAKLPWGHKCLRAGEYCKVGNKAYLRYGFVCPKTKHLRRR